MPLRSDRPCPRPRLLPGLNCNDIFSFSGPPQFAGIKLSSRALTFSYRKEMSKSNDYSLHAVSAFGDVSFLNSPHMADPSNGGFRSYSRATLSRTSFALSLADREPRSRAITSRERGQVEF